MKEILVTCKDTRSDNLLSRSLMHLERSCKVSIATDGQNAFEKISQQTFDLLIIDNQLPDMNASKLAESINYIDPGVPVILMVDQQQKPVKDAICCAWPHILARPFNPIKFLRLVDRLLYTQSTRYHS